VNTRVIRRVDTGYLEQRSRSATPWPRYLQLRTLDIELGPVLVPFVEPDVLDSNEILARWDFRRDGKLEPVLLVRAPVSIAARILATESNLVGLEPITVSFVGGHRIWGLGHVDETRAGMLDKLVVEQLESDLVARVHIICLCARVGFGSVVASEISRVDNVGGKGRVVRVGIPAEVVVLATDAFAVDNEDVEDVMRVNHCRGGDEKDEGLHGKAWF